MAYTKNYTPTTWKDKPSTDTSINAYRLNKLENGVNTNDNRVVALSQDKLDVTEANQMVQSVTMDTKTGVMTVTLKNGVQTNYDLDIEKVVANFDLDEDNNLILTLADGTKKTVPLASLVDTYTFESSTTISFSEAEKNITAIIPDGAVTLAKLESTVISTIRQYTLDAQTAKGQAEQAAAISQGYAVGGEGFESSNAQYFAGQAQRYAVITDDAPTDNAQYYCQQAQAAAEEAAGAVGFDGTAVSVSAVDSHSLGSDTVQGQLDALAAPSFDDSGEAAEITGFQAFLDKLTSGVKFLDFFRDLKAGLKFVLHTGQLVNNGLCTEAGKFPLDAAFGKTLQDQVNTLNGNLADLEDNTVKCSSFRFVSGAELAVVKSVDEFMDLIPRNCILKMLNSNSTERQVLVDLGLLPFKNSGFLTIVRNSSNYITLEFISFGNVKNQAVINNGKLSSWI